MEIRVDIKTKQVRRYTGEARIFDGVPLIPGRFISKDVFDRLPARDTITQTVRTK